MIDYKKPSILVKILQYTVGFCVKCDFKPEFEVFLADKSGFSLSYEGLR